MAKYLLNVVSESEHQRDWDQNFLWPTAALYMRPLARCLLCALRAGSSATLWHSFGCKPDDDVASEDYVSHLIKRMEAIHD